MTKASAPSTFTVSVPIQIRRRGGQKLVVLPGSVKPASGNTVARPDRKVLLSLARALRWQRQLDAGVRTTMAEIAEAEGLTASYVARVLRMLLYAPAIVDAVVWTDELQEWIVDEVERVPAVLWCQQMNRAMTLEQVPAKPTGRKFAPKDQRPHCAPLNSFRSSRPAAASRAPRPQTQTCDGSVIVGAPAGQDISQQKAWEIPTSLAPADKKGSLTERMNLSRPPQTS